LAKAGFDFSVASGEGELMKVLFSQSLPFFLAHGGTQTFVESLLRELPALTVEIEPVRWWDETQQGDIIHFVGRPSFDHVRLAQQKGFKVVMTEFLDQPASRHRLTLFAQRLCIQFARNALTEFTGRLAWDAYRQLDAMIYAVPHEWETAKYLFNANPARGFVIPHGIEPAALAALRQPADEADYLISIATIAPRKNTHLLAAAAKLAQVPVLFVGKPYADDDPYFEQFMSTVDNQYVRYAGFVSNEEKYGYLRRARGFALLSQFESGCIAVYEAAAAGLPLFLSDLPWAAKAYVNAKNSRFVTPRAREHVAKELADFYGSAHRLPETTFPLLSWREVAERYRAIYEKILGERRR
jgi:glycosyltransferase involved in cell wall biosynthesis